jgi:hypothetical protein
MDEIVAELRVDEEALTSRTNRVYDSRSRGDNMRLRCTWTRVSWARISLTLTSVNEVQSETLMSGASTQFLSLFFRSYPVTISSGTGDFFLATTIRSSRPVS